MGAALALVPQGRKPASGEWTSSDALALTIFWNQLEAACGVRSTMEGQIALLNRRSISDSAVREAASEKRRSRRPKAVTTDYLGIDPVLEPGEPTPGEREDLKLGEFTQQEIHIKESSSGPVVDPYEDDNMLRSIRTSRVIRGRLKSVSARCVGVLHAAYGPMRGDNERNNGLRKKFGDPLIEIVVGIVWMAHKDLSIPAAREMAFWKSKDESFVTMQKRQAQKILDGAHAEYGQAKLVWI